MAGRVLIVGTRGSALAVEQARRVMAGVEGASEIRIVRTSGDRCAEIPLGEQNPVGFFTKEIEDELLSGRIDLAVHSLKDLPTQLTLGLAMAAMLTRDDPADILLLRPEALASGDALPLKQGAAVGASSRRRSAMLQRFRPDCTTLPIRGNVPTRVDKVRQGDFDATLLSRAGLARLGLRVDPLLSFELNPRSWPGAPGQAIIAVEARADDAEALGRVSSLHDPATAVRANAERRLLAVFGGGCHSPFGAYSEVGPATALMVVAAPGREGGFQIERFEGADLESAGAEAEAWIRSGSAPRKKGQEEWLCRAARSWC
jgi:hydroxymethylbilane synthase